MNPVFRVQTIREDTCTHWEGRGCEAVVKQTEYCVDGL
jgi:hypothetical protein